MLTVNWNCYRYYQKISKGPGRLCSSKGGACAMAQWHNGQSKPGDTSQSANHATRHCHFRHCKAHAACVAADHDFCRSTIRRWLVNRSPRVAVRTSPVIILLRPGTSLFSRPTLSKVCDIHSGRLNISVWICVGEQKRCDASVNMVMFVAFCLVAVDTVNHYAVVTTKIRLRFDGRSTGVRLLVKGH